MAPVHLADAVWSGAFLVQGLPETGSSAASLQDSLSGRFVDSVVVRSPLADPLVPIVQWIFQRPSWVMISGIVVAAVVGVAILGWLWRRRRPIGRWLVTRDRGVKLALGASVGAVLLLVLGGGLKVHNYVIHDNDFCRGCHIFVPSGQIFVQPDTGSYLLVNKVEVHTTALMPCVSSLRHQGSKQGVVLLDHCPAGQDPSACQGAAAGSVRMSCAG